MKIFGIVLALLLVVAVIGLPIFFTSTPIGVGLWNSWFYQVQKVDDKTNYDTRKEVEDSCRAMIASYEADKLTYEQYKDSEKSEEQSWATQAKMRANRTAVNYNNYILKNSFVWEDNIPADIKGNLPTIE